MNLHEIPDLNHFLTHYLIPFGTRLVGAFAVWIIGGFFVKGIQRVLVVGLKKRHVDSTLVTYAHNTAGAVFKVLLLLAILGLFGLETTSFSALLAAAGVAIGVAWSGLLSNFAAGIFLILFRPFKVGDYISAAGVNGIVREIGMFATSIDNPENLRIFVGNNKLFSENILNYSANYERIASFRIQLPTSVDPSAAIKTFEAKFKDLDGNEVTPVITGEITEFNLQGTVITMKVHCPNHAHSSVLHQGNEIIYQTLKSGI